MGGPVNAFEVLQARGLVQQYTAEVPEILAGDTPVTFYVGFDPTADSLHVGHLLPLMAMAHLQRAGHRPIALLGGGTAMVGDPSFKDEMRAMLSTEQIDSNLQGMRKQMDLVLDFDEQTAGAKAAMLVNNADWLCSLNYMHFLRHVARHFSVNNMLTKASVKLRLEKGLSLLEFNYQVLQAYDFLELHERHGCMLQMGGDDQWGNITAGIDLIRRVNGGEAHALTFPLLTTAEGKKMGKTAKGAVWLSADRLSPYEYFQYWVNVDDRDVGKLLRIFTFLPMDRIEALEALQGADVREAKRVLAFEATAIAHGKEEATKAMQGAQAAFSGGGAVDAMPSITAQLPALVVDLLVQAELCKSKGEARRQIQQGAIKLGMDRGRPVTSHELMVTSEDIEDGGVVIWRGKKKSVRVVTP
ncbi:MAG: tyrosine--tRNA ligase [Myxococcota bacterium]|nr:tyrosine--tRNA ligase [Myxococcota bacterium]